MLVAAESPGYAELGWTGVELIFAPANFIAESKTHVTVKYRDALGVITTLNDGVHLTLTRNAATGAITAAPLALPAAPGTLIFIRITPAVQNTDFANLVEYDPAVHTTLHDRAMLGLGEARRDLAVTVRVPLGEAGFELPSVALRANKQLIFDATGKIIAIVSAAAVILNGAGVPAAGLGKDGDLYIRTSNGDLYAKAAGAWAVIGNLIGPQGPAGTISGAPDGTLGAPGIAFASETGSGIRRAGAGDVRHVVTGVDVLKKQSTLVTSLVDFTVVGRTILSGAIHRGGVITAAQLTGNVNDYAPTGGDVVATWILSSDASRNITGAAAPASGGREVFLWNGGSNPIVLKNQDAGSAAANRFLIGQDLALPPNKYVAIWYDAAASRWRVRAPRDYAAAGQYIGNVADKVLTADKVWGDAVPLAVADGATITLDFGAAIHFEIAAMAGNRTLAVPSNRKAGQDGLMLYVQDGTGTRIPSPNAVFKNFPVLSTAINKKDYVSYHVNAALDVICAMYAKGL